MTRGIFKSLAATLLTSVTLLALSSSYGNAAVFTESVQFGPGPTDFNGSSGTTAGPNGNQLYYFDSNGGTLNSISFAYSYTFSSTITLTNASNTTASGTVRTQSAAQFIANSPAVTAALKTAVDTYIDPVDGNSVSFGSSTLTPIAADVRGTPSNYSLSSGGSTSVSSSGSFSRPSFTVTDASVLSAFSVSGGGTFTPLFNTLTGLILTSSSGSVTATQTSTAQGNLVLTYNFTSGTVPPPTSVPEPASMLLLGVALLGAGAVRRPA